MPTTHFPVPIDFSTYAEQALDYAIRLAHTLNARLAVREPTSYAFATPLAEEV